MGDGQRDDTGRVRQAVGRRQVLQGLAGAGALVALGRLTPTGIGGILRAGSHASSLTGTISATFDFVTGVAAVEGATNLGGSVAVEVVVTALL
ncbi:MAG: hypothetical protein ACSLFP_16375, partial [Acidimicrobiales bacterium]